MWLTDKAIVGPVYLFPIFLLPLQTKDIREMIETPRRLSDGTPMAAFAHMKVAKALVPYLSGRLVDYSFGNARVLVQLLENIDSDQRLKGEILTREELDRAIQVAGDQIKIDAILPQDLTWDGPPEYALTTDDVRGMYRFILSSLLIQRDFA
jgi:hypothetical protein